MLVFFRTDASTRIGTGHVMRCLTLAHALREIGYECVFIHRTHQGNLADVIRERGFSVILLPQPDTTSGITADGDYSAWLGVSQEIDAEQSITAIDGMQSDWMDVDHYSLDAEWETKLKMHVGKILSIDDIANRNHVSDVLLDQNFGSEQAKYKEYVKDDCTILAGSEYSLLRPEFQKWREISLKRRDTCNKLDSILISMGGVDTDNITGKVLKCYLTCCRDCCDGTISPSYRSNSGSS